MEICNKCNGKQFLFDPHKRVCTHCLGTGEVEDWIEQVTGKTRVIQGEILNLGTPSLNAVTKKYVDSELIHNEVDIMKRIKARYGV